MREKLPQYDNNEMKRRIAAEIHKTRDRKILMMHLVNGYSLMEIANATNIPHSTVRDVWRRHKKHLFPPE